jgi:hypothetical protein
MLESYRLAGRKVFLATNSLWDYTHVVMNYLISGHIGADKTEDWLEVRVLSLLSDHCCLLLLS